MPKSKTDNEYMLGGGTKDDLKASESQSGRKKKETEKERKEGRIKENKSGYE